MIPSALRTSLALLALLGLGLAPGCWGSDETDPADAGVDAGPDAGADAGPDGGDCVPDCGSRVCGLDPVCGLSCGSCAPDETCSAAGSCEVASNCQSDCDGLILTECSCGSADPCGWQGDGVCDSACLQVAPQDYFDDSADCGCTPDCSGRACGPDPVCGFECGSCATGTCDGAGHCVTGGDGPSIFGFRIDPNPAGIFSDPISFTVVVQDPDGLGDIDSVVMSTPGADYGTLPRVSSSAFGTMSSWDELNAIEPILATAASGATRVFTVVVTDLAGNTATASETLILRCFTPDNLLCEPGECVDVMSDPRHCGRCGEPVPTNAICQDGVPVCGSPFYEVALCGDTCRVIEDDDANCGACDRSCPGIATSLGAATGQCIGQLCYVTYEDHPVRDSCDSLCAAGGLTCPSASGTSAFYATPDGSNSTTMSSIGCNTVPPAVHPTYSALDFVSVRCECRG